MNEKLFRKASIDRVNSPEQLNEYIRVARPAVWLILAVVVALLLGVIIWGVFGTVETNVTAGVAVDEEGAICYVLSGDAAKLEAGMTVTIGNATGSIQGIADAPVSASALSDYLRYLTGFSEGDFCYAASLDLSGVAQGEYAATITVSSIHPISFVIH